MVHVTDFRNPSETYLQLRGHRSTVTYLEFLDDSSIVSAWVCKARVWGSEGLVGKWGWVWLYTAVCVFISTCVKYPALSFILHVQVHHEWDAEVGLYPLSYNSQTLPGPCECETVCWFLSSWQWKVHRLWWGEGISRCCLRDKNGEQIYLLCREWEQPVFCLWKVLWWSTTGIPVRQWAAHQKQSVYQLSHLEESEWVHVTLINCLFNVHHLFPSTILTQTMQDAPVVLAANSLGHIKVCVPYIMMQVVVKS